MTISRATQDSTSGLTCKNNRERDESRALINNNDMNQFAIITSDNVCRMIIKAEDMISALYMFEKITKNKSISDDAVAILYSDYKKTKK